MLLLLCAAQACASSTSDIDDFLLEDGIVNEDYEVIDEKKFMIAMMHMNAAMKKRMKKEAGDKGFVSVTPRGVYYKYIWDSKSDRILTEEEVASYREYSFYAMCRNLGDSQVFRKRNWIVRVETINEAGQRRFAQNIALKDCPLITDEDIPDDEDDIQEDDNNPVSPSPLKMPSRMI